MKERIKGRKNYPTDEVDPDHFLSDDEIMKLARKMDSFKFSKEDFKTLYNCVHCGECETESERFQLKQKYVEDGNSFNEVNEMLEHFEKYRSPYPSNKMRIKLPSGISEESDTLFFMGCLSTIRIPRYTEHALQYLLNLNVDFTTLQKEICCGWHLLAAGLKSEYETCKKENIEIFKKFNKIICLCPACYDLFRKDYAEDMDKDIKVEYIADYLKPSEKPKSGKIGIQHLCQLINRGREGVDKLVNKVLEKSGYDVVDIPHWCCGGGSGYMGRTEVIDAIATKRMQDFDAAGLDIATTYCPSCWWILRRYSKLCKIQPKVKDLFELLL